MDRLKTAIERLDTAVVHLDRAIAGRLARMSGDRDAAVRQAAEAAARIDALERELAAARAGEQDARAQVDAVAGRLDGAIDRLRLVLEEQE